METGYSQLIRKFKAVSKAAGIFHYTGRRMICITHDPNACISRERNSGVKPEQHDHERAKTKKIADYHKNHAEKCYTI